MTLISKPGILYKRLIFLICFIAESCIACQVSVTLVTTKFASNVSIILQYYVVFSPSSFTIWD